MGASLPKASEASHREELAAVRGKAVKVSLSTQVTASRLRDVAADAVRAFSGNARAAAIDLDIHEGHLSRLMKDGTLRLEQLEVLGPAFAARLGEELVRQFAPLRDPKEQLRDLIRTMRRITEELEQGIDYL